MRRQRPFLDCILREWLLFASLAGVTATSLYLGEIPALTPGDIRVVYLLAVLFVSVKGLERSGLVSRMSRIIEKGRFMPLKLVSLTLALSMVVTNDVALIIIVPLTMAVDTDKKDVLVILEALAANAGSALTPFGNPQNLFIYWFYDLEPGDFIAAIAPFTVIFIAFLVTASLLIKTTRKGHLQSEPPRIGHAALAHGALLLIVILTVLRLLPLSTGIVVIVYAVLFDRDSLRIDYALLLTFIAFMALAENVKDMVGTILESSGHIFILSALASQVVSNVPAALVLSKFTTQWKALLWGTNVGGFGSLVGSLANMIAYKIFISRGATGRQTASFTAKFVLSGYAAFLIGVGLYFIARASWSVPG